MIELGMPFSDPMADGPAIQASSLRALQGGPEACARRSTWCAHSARRDQDTPIVLMGYYNPIYVYPGEASSTTRKAAGVDGLIVVDLPPEADDELCLPAVESGPQLHPPGDADHRRQAACRRSSRNTSGFVYYVSITGITGSAAPECKRRSLAGCDASRQSTPLPVAVGFGVKTPEQAKPLPRVPTESSSARRW